MASGKLNLTIEQGATWIFEGTWFVDDDESDPVDLTGYEARLQIRETHESAAPLLSLEADDIALGGAAGTIEIVVSADATALLAAGNWVYDLELESPGGQVTRLLEGRMVVTPEVTR